MSGLVPSFFRRWFGSDGEMERDRPEPATQRRRVRDRKMEEGKKYESR
jgi:hypothetical protein